MSTEKYKYDAIVVDVDSTVTDPNGRFPGANCLLNKAVVNVVKSKKAPKLTRMAAAMVYPFIYMRMVQKPDQNPSPRDLRYVGALAKNIPVDDVVRDMGVVRPYKAVLDWLRRKKEEGYKIIAATAGPDIFVENWENSLEGGPVFDRIYGLKLKTEDGNFAGVDYTDPFTNICATKGSKKAKGYVCSLILKDGGNITYSAGNSLQDLPSKEDIREFGVEEGTLSELNVTNIYMPVKGTPMVCTNGDIGSARMACAYD